MQNYFNHLSFRRALMQLGRCRFMDASEFKNGVTALKDAKIVVIGCGSQGLNQALCLRDSGLNISIVLREQAIKEQRDSWKNATEHKFTIGTEKELIGQADLVINLTPDKQHANVLKSIVPLMKKNACLSYSHGFNIVEEGQQIRSDICVIMVAPKGPGTEVRHEFQRGFGVPTLIAVHEENNPRGDGLGIACAYAVGIGANRAGVLESSFIAEVKSDLMGEQTILCGLLQTGSLLCFDHMCKQKIPNEYAAGLVQYGWENLGEALKHGGITGMMQNLSDEACVIVYRMSEELKSLMRPLFTEHMDNIMNGSFSANMMKDWQQDDKIMLSWRQRIGASQFEKATATDNLNKKDFFEKGLLMVAILKAGIELAFEVMQETGIKEESAYYESLHELPLIANLIGRQKLYEMNRVISDTAEYGCHLFSEKAMPLLKNYIESQSTDVIGGGLTSTTKVDMTEFKEIKATIQNHPIETIGATLRKHMTAMKQVV